MKGTRAWHPICTSLYYNISNWLKSTPFSTRSSTFSPLIHTPIPLWKAIEHMFSTITSIWWGEDVGARLRLRSHTLTPPGCQAGTNLVQVTETMTSSTQFLDRRFDRRCPDTYDSGHAGMCQRHFKCSLAPFQTTTRFSSRARYLAMRSAAIRNLQLREEYLCASTS